MSDLVVRIFLMNDDNIGHNLQKSEMSKEGIMDDCNTLIVNTVHQILELVFVFTVYAFTNYFFVALFFLVLKTLDVFIFT